MRNINDYVTDIDIDLNDKVIGTEATTGITKNYKVKDLVEYFDGLIDGGGGAEIVDITWVALVALTTREVGQLYNITTANPLDAVIYGEIILDSENQFTYQESLIIHKIITIQ